MKFLLICLIFPGCLMGQPSLHPFYPREESTECVPPEMISQLYFSYDCTILSINDDLTLNVELITPCNGKSRNVTITLAGLTFDSFSSEEMSKTKDAILLLTKGHKLSASSSVDNDPQHPLPLYHIDLNDAGNTRISLNFSLLREGLALFKHRGYDTDSYLNCQFRKAQADAIREKMGHWQSYTQTVQQDIEKTKS